MAAYSPHPWLKHVRSVLMAKAGITQLLGRAAAPGGERAMYVTHLSAVDRVQYPAVSLHHSYDMDLTHGQMMRGTLQVDVWCPDRPRDQTKGQPVGKDGLWRIYGPMRSILHRGHLLIPNIWSSATHEVKWMFELRCDDSLYEPAQHLYHLAAVYDVLVGEVGNCYPNRALAAG